MCLNRADYQVCSIFHFYSCDSSFKLSIPQLQNIPYHCEYVYIVEVKTEQNRICSFNVINVCYRLCGSIQVMYSESHSVDLVEMLSVQVQAFYIFSSSFISPV